MQVYTGKGLDNGVSDVGLCTKVVFKLMKGFDHMAGASESVWPRGYGCTNIFL